MNLKEIQNLIKFVAKSGVTEVKLEMDDIKITIKTEDSEKTIKRQEQVLIHTPQIAPPIVQSVITSEPEIVSQETTAEKDSKYITIKSPIIGTFYRKSSPDKPLFVEVGQTIAEGDVLCVIEAMKLFNEIESEVSGTIIKILVDDSSPVEFDQPLFLVDPS